MKRVSSVLYLILVMLVGIFPSNANSKLISMAMAQATESANTDPVLVGAGDIAMCNSAGGEATAALLEHIDGTIFTAGDNVYDVGSLARFRACYEPSWGRYKDRTYPTLGNHDYAWRQGRDYYAYFGKVAGKLGEGYYSFDLGTWHIVMLNSNLDVDQNSKQVIWLRDDLATHVTICTLAVWHHPRFSSGLHGSDTRFTALWNTLYQAGVDVVVNGHDHHYERFAPQTADGTANANYGIREFVVGTGGATLYPRVRFEANSETFANSTWGVIKFTLHERSFSWKFIPTTVDGFHDSGTADCHAKPPVAS